MRKNELIDKLRSEILSLQGLRPPAVGARPTQFGLGPVERAFPNGIFPTGDVAFGGQLKWEASGVVLTI